MKRFFAILTLVLTVALAVNAKPKVQTIGFFDTNDSKIGHHELGDVRISEELMRDIKNALGDEVTDVTYTVYKGNNCNYRNAVSAINGLNCEDDIVIFFYSGHGCRSINDPSKFPLMCLGSDNLDEFLAIDKGVDMLLKKHPRMLVFIANCCNSYYDAPYGSQQGYTTSQALDPAAVKKLLLGNQGHVVITGAHPGEYSWIRYEGGSFLFKSLQDKLKLLNGDNATWSKLFKDTHDDVVKISTDAYNSRSISNIQHPLYKIAVGQRNIPGSDPRPYGVRYKLGDTQYRYNMEFYDSLDNTLTTFVLDLQDYLSPNTVIEYPINDSYKGMGVRKDKAVTLYMGSNDERWQKELVDFSLPEEWLDDQPEQIRLYIRDCDEELVDRLDFCDVNDKLLRTIMLHRDIDGPSDAGEYPLTDRSKVVITINADNNYRIATCDTDGTERYSFVMTRLHKRVQNPNDNRSRITDDDEDRGHDRDIRSHNDRSDNFTNILGLLAGLIILILGFSWGKIQGPLAIVFKIIGVAVIIIYLLNLLG